jgi:hypothetical protein
MSGYYRGLLPAKAGVSHPRAPWRGQDTSPVGYLETENAGEWGA